MASSYKVTAIQFLKQVGGGAVFTWGQGRAGALGHELIDREGVCALPAVVDRALRAVQVACGTDATAALTPDGQVLSWGRGVRLGHGDDCHGRGGRGGGATAAAAAAASGRRGQGVVVTKPTVIHSLRSVTVIQIAMGDSHAGCIVEGGTVVMWGSGRHGCLGAQSGSAGRLAPDPSQPVLVPRGATKMAGSGGSSSRQPLLAVQIECGYFTTAVIGAGDGGCLWTWGSNKHFVLGLDVRSDQSEPVPNPILCGARKHSARSDGGMGSQKNMIEAVRCIDISLGTVYAGAIDSLGRLWTWGYGGHGNLGHGNRVSLAVPTLVESIDYSRLQVLSVGCTRGQSGPKGGFFYPKGTKGDNARTPGVAAAHSKIVGSEGPHTLASAVERHMFRSRGNSPDDLAGDTAEQSESVPVAVASIDQARHSDQAELNARKACTSRDGAVDDNGVCGRAGVYAWGTGHKGQLANVDRKPKLGDRFDELSPYLIGGPSRNSSKRGLTGYFADARSASVPIVQVATANIHCLALDSAGRIFAWGCGSGGRCGVEAFLTGLHGSRSRMKCYMAEPQRVGLCTDPTVLERYPRGGRLASLHAVQIATTRWHSAAIAVRKDVCAPPLGNALPAAAGIAGEVQPDTLGLSSDWAHEEDTSR